MRNGKNGAQQGPFLDTLDRRSFLIRALSASTLTLLAGAAALPTASAARPFTAGGPSRPSPTSRPNRS